VSKPLGELAELFQAVERDTREARARRHEEALQERKEIERDCRRDARRRAKMLALRDAHRA
jgi:hypothetical protein